MPELPEVETIRIQLQKYFVGHEIEGVKIRYGKCFIGDKENLVDGKVVRVRRFGKLLSIDLSNNHSILIHVKMTGQLIYRGPNLKSTKKLSEKVKDGLGGKHTHVIFCLNQNAALYFNDVRKFGWIKVIKTDKVEENEFVKKLGLEPFVGQISSGQAVLTLGKFSTIVQSTGRSIKTLLMDQRKIAGVGNIYANDALWLSKIHPERKSSSLSPNKQKKLFKAIETVLKAGLKYHGASENSFVTPDGMEGMYQQHFLVYGKEGGKCGNKCGGVIKKIKVGGRGTYFCPRCQNF